MYELKIRDYCFIAHSLKDDFFGPAKNLHGVTYVIDLVISSENLIDKNIIIDIGVATDILKKVISNFIDSPHPHVSDTLGFINLNPDSKSPLS